MIGDFSRFPNGYSGQYSGVLAQQGRLLLDAELNEQHAILLDYLRCLTTDLIGPFAAPIHQAGFAVYPVVQDGKCRAVRLSRGHYYVYGLRCEVPAPHQSARQELAIGEHEPPFVVFLVVWEQSVSAIQVPGLIDPALSASVPDTTRRSQVRWLPMAGRRLPGHEENLTELEPDRIIAAFQDYDADPRRRPTLGARAHAGGEPEPGPDTAPVPWGYRGVENQLYRVEIHHGGDAEEATFKWSRDNGSVEFGLESLGEPDGDGVRTATLRRLWYDARRGLEVDDWVELVDDRWAPFGTPAPLLQVKGVSMAARQVTLQDTDRDRDFDIALHPFLRRWDQQPGGQAPNHGIPVREAFRSWFELEKGVQIRFEAPAALHWRGDFWLIPARTATRDVLWPQSRDAEPAPLAIPAEGPQRYLAPLALLRHPSDELVDLRVMFGYRAGEHHEDADRGHPTMEHEILLADAPVAIRSPGVLNRLRSISSVDRGSIFTVRDGTTIGRGPDAGIRFELEAVSRRHAVFHVENEALTITDEGSTNGTWVNGRRLAARVPVTLAPNDTIQVGSPEVQLRVEQT